MKSFKWLFIYLKFYLLLRVSQSCLDLYTLQYSQKIINNNIIYLKYHIAKTFWLTIDMGKNKGRTCCQKKTLGKTTFWLKALRVVSVPCCRLNPVIRWSNEVKLASAKFRLGQESFSFLLYLRTHILFPRKSELRRVKETIGRDAACQ